METHFQDKHILLIDDDAVSNMINTKIIKKNFDFTVNAFTNAKVALDQLMHWTKSANGESPQIIFLDINMPLMDGWEFLEEYQKFPESLLSICKVYMLTSSIDLDDIEKAKTYPLVSDFISKPLTSEKLRNLIQL